MSDYLAITLIFIITWALQSQYPLALLIYSYTYLNRFLGISEQAMEVTLKLFSLFIRRPLRVRVLAIEQQSRTFPFFLLPFHPSGYNCTIISFPRLFLPFFRLSFLPSFFSVTIAQEHTCHDPSFLPLPVFPSFLPSFRCYYCTKTCFPQPFLPSSVLPLLLHEGPMRGNSVYTRGY